MNADAQKVDSGGYRLPDLRGLLLLYVPVFTVLSLVIVTTFARHIPVSMMTRDMAAIAKVHPLTGAVSNVGILLWCAAAAICFFTASLLRERGAHREARFLAWSGLLTTALLVDDFFMLHEYLAPVHLHLNEKAVHASYFGATAVYLVLLRRQILDRSFHLLAAALVFFASSVLVDVTDGRGWWVLAEDGFKLLGIGSWFGYYASRARYSLAQSPVMRGTATNVGGLDQSPATAITN